MTDTRWPRPVTTAVQMPLASGLPYVRGYVPCSYPQPRDSIVVRLVPTLLALLLSACGASAITTQARLDATLVTLTQQAAHVRDDARSAALDRVEAEHADDRAARNAALEAESHRWDASADALDALTAAERTWADAIQLAQTAGSEALLPLLLPTLMHLVQLYNAAARVVHELGVDLPAIPATITQLLTPQGGT